MSFFSNLFAPLSRLLDSSVPGFNGRPRIGSFDQDHHKLVSQDDHRNVLSLSRKIAANLGVVNGALHDKATYSVGNAWKPVFTGKNRRWGERATEWLLESFYPYCDVAGPNFDFVSSLKRDSYTLDVDGDTFILLSETETGFPTLQRIPAHRIAYHGRSAELEDGPYAGLHCFNGVVVNKKGRPVAYAFHDHLGEVTYLKAESVIHLYEPEYYDQYRGLPAFSSSLNALQSFLTTQDYEEQAAMLASSIGLIEHNEMGMADPSDPSSYIDQHDPAQGPKDTVEQVTGGSIRYIKSNSGGKIEVLKPDRPGEAWESFQDRLVRTALAAISWPYELTWKAGELTGTSVRLKIGQAMRTITSRQNTLKKAAKRMVTYAIAKAMSRGDLPFNKDWMRWDFTMPAKLSIDNGRDAANVRADYEAGMRTLTSILGEEGRSLEEHLRERAHEQKLMQDILNESSEEQPEQEEN